MLNGILGGRGGCELGSSLASLKCVGRRAIVKVREVIFVLHAVIQLVATQRIRFNMNIATQCAPRVAEKLRTVPPRLWLFGGGQHVKIRRRWYKTSVDGRIVNERTTRCQKW